MTKQERSDKPDRHYVASKFAKRADHLARQIMSTASKDEDRLVGTPGACPSRCQKCQGPLGVQSFQSRFGRSWEAHCRMCGKTYPL